MTVCASTRSVRKRSGAHDYYQFAANSRQQIQALASNLCLLGNVNFFFLIHVAQEEQKGAGAKNNRQPQSAPTVKVSAAWVRVSNEPVKRENRATQRGHTYN